MFALFGQGKKVFRSLALTFLRLYQKIISPFLPKACRYYPSCSEYANWRFKNQSPLLACYFVLLRILRCHQLSDGGIDYPVIRKSIKPEFSQPFTIIFWLIPSRDYIFNLHSHYYQDKFLIVKSFKEVK